MGVQQTKPKKEEYVGRRSTVQPTGSDLSSPQRNTEGGVSIKKTGQASRGEVSASLDECLSRLGSGAWDPDDEEAAKVFMLMSRMPAATRARHTMQSLCDVATSKPDALQDAVDAHPACHSLLLPHVLGVAADSHPAFFLSAATQVALFMRCDKAVLFLPDPTNPRKLHTYALPQGGSKACRVIVPADAGVLGRVVSGRETVRAALPEAAKKGYNSTIDEEVRYEADALLAVPVTTPRGVGVLQVVSRRGVWREAVPAMPAAASSTSVTPPPAARTASGCSSSGADSSAVPPAAVQRTPQQADPLQESGISKRSPDHLDPDEACSQGDTGCAHAFDKDSEDGDEGDDARSAFGHRHAADAASEGGDEVDSPRPVLQRSMSEGDCRSGSGRGAEAVCGGGVAEAKSPAHGAAAQQGRGKEGAQEERGAEGQAGFSAADENLLIAIATILSTVLWERG